MSEVIHISRATQPLDRYSMRYRNNWKAQREYQDYKAAEYKARNEKDWREARRASVRRNREKVRALILELLGGPRCVRCSFSDMRALQIDHVNGGGRRERASTKNYCVARVYADVLKWGREKYQVLCANCNQIKKIEDGELANFEKRNTLKKVI